MRQLVRANCGVPEPQAVNVDPARAHAVSIPAAVPTVAILAVPIVAVVCSSDDVVPAYRSIDVDAPVNIDVSVDANVPVHVDVLVDVSVPVGVDVSVPVHTHVVPMNRFSENGRRE